MRGLSDSRTNREKAVWEFAAGHFGVHGKIHFLEQFPAWPEGSLPSPAAFLLVCVDPDPGMLSCNGALSSGRPSLMGVHLVAQSFPKCSAPCWTCGCCQNPMRPRGAEEGRVGFRILSLCRLQSQARERDNEADDTKKERNKTKQTKLC